MRDYFTDGYAKSLDRAWDKHQNSANIGDRRQAALEYTSWLESAQMNALEVTFKDGRHEVK